VTKGFREILDCVASLALWAGHKAIRAFRATQVSMDKQESKETPGQASRVRQVFRVALDFMDRQEYREIPDSTARRAFRARLEFRGTREPVSRARLEFRAIPGFRA
jgi:hypothetical protein